jgi:hypothetical protein
VKKTKPIYKLNYYKKILNIIKKFKISNFDLITNYGLFSGDTNLFKTLTIKYLIDRTAQVKGDIIEFGVWRGNTSFLIKKILDIYKIKKKIYLFDHFKGLIHFKKIDQVSLGTYGDYVGNKNLIIKLINFFKFKNIEVIDYDATKLKKNFFKKKFSLVIIDVDLYLPTTAILNSINDNISKGGLIVFDEGNDAHWPGEKKAMKEFLIKYPKDYKKEFIKNARQPDVILKKIR